MESTLKPASHESLFLCPACGEMLNVDGRCSCGFAVREDHGILHLMTKEESAAEQPYVEAYEKVRSDEQWGDDDLDLPFHPRRHLDVWRVRQRTFRAVEGIISKAPRGVALDVGAGNCWMTRYLDSWGFDAVAIDINTSRCDGLQAGEKFIEAGARFRRVRAGMERLPFVSERITLIAANGSFHYANDFRAALLEFQRVLTPGGMIVIADTPFYRNGVDGERTVAERVVSFRRKYGIPEMLSSRARYLTFVGFEEIARTTEMGWRLYPVWPGLERRYREFLGLLTQRRLAQFPVVVMVKREK